MANDPTTETSPVEHLGPRPTLMPRALTILLGLAAATIAAQAIQPIQSTLASAFLALNIVIVVWPVQRWLVKYVPRFLAALVAGILSIAILVALVGSVGWTITRLIQTLPQYSGKFTALVNQLGDYLVRLRDNNQLVQQIWSQLAQFNFTSLLGPLQSLGSGISGLVGFLVTIILILIFMVVDSADFSDRMRRLGERHNPTLAWALASFASGTRKYWVVTTVFGLTVALGNWGLLAILGVPLALVWALLSFVSNYIPYVGFVIGLVPPAIMALLANDPWTALWVVIGYCVINVVFNVLIMPKFTGDAVGITPTMAVLSLLIWAYVLGPFGAILAIPSTLLMKTLLIDIDPETRWLNAFIASNPTTSDQDPVHLSRLLARAKSMRKSYAKDGVEAHEPPTDPSDQ